MARREIPGRLGYKRRRAKPANCHQGNRWPGTGHHCLRPHKADECRRRIAAAGFGGSRHRERTTTRFVLSACGDFTTFEQFRIPRSRKANPWVVHGASRETTRTLLEVTSPGTVTDAEAGRSASLQWVANSANERWPGCGFSTQRAFGVVASVRKSNGPEPRSLKVELSGSATVEGVTCRQ